MAICFCGYIYGGRRGNNKKDYGRTIRIHGDGPVHQIQIYVIQTQTLQTQIEILLHARMVCAPEFGGDEDVFSLDARCERFLEPRADLIFVVVAVCPVDVPVPDGERI